MNVLATILMTSSHIYQLLIKSTKSLYNTCEFIFNNNKIVFYFILFYLSKFIRVRLYIQIIFISAVYGITKSKQNHIGRPQFFCKLTCYD